MQLCMNVPSFSGKMIKTVVTGDIKGKQKQISGESQKNLIEVRRETFCMIIQCIAIDIIKAPSNGKMNQINYKNGNKTRMSLSSIHVLFLIGNIEMKGKLMQNSTFSCH